MDQNAPVDVIFARINTCGLISRKVAAFFSLLAKGRQKKPDYSEVRIKSFN